jgi:hypothetical protein
MLFIRYIHETARVLFVFLHLHGRWVPGVLIFLLLFRFWVRSPLLFLCLGGS